jgi:hypothetical protein
MQDGRRGEEQGSRSQGAAKRMLARRMHTPARQSAKKASSRRRELTVVQINEDERWGGQIAENLLVGGLLCKWLQYRESTSSRMSSKHQTPHSMSRPP